MPPRLLHAGETVIQLAAYIRSLGYACQVEHPIGDGDLLHIPIGLKAGFGELGRHGSSSIPRLVRSFAWGAWPPPRSRDRPSHRRGHRGVLRHVPRVPEVLPAHAIPDERRPEAGVDHLGNPRYVVDTSRCFPYFARHNYCSICLPVCLQPQGWARDFEGHRRNSFHGRHGRSAATTRPDLPQPMRHVYPLLKRSQNTFFSRLMIAVGVTMSALSGSLAAARLSAPSKLP